MDKRYLKWYVLVGALAFVLSQLYARPETRALLSLDYWQSLLRYGHIMRLVQSEYVEPGLIDYTSFTDAALNGALKKLDRHSIYYTTKDFETFNNDANQTYVGVGIEIGYYGGKTYVSDVFSEGSAGLAGIQTGDRIVGVDDVDLGDSDIPEILDAIRGEPGSEVSLEVERMESEERLRYTMVRKQITLQSVTDATLLEGEVGYVRVRQFTDDTDAELLGAIKGLSGRGLQGLIIDLRGNPGGRLDTATRMAELFLDPGQVILKVQSREGIEEVIRAESSEASFEFPMAVLIDRLSASASEILAGALRDHGRATVIGETSFGKGSVQGVFSFPNGDGLKLTVARYLLPNGQAVNEVGVKPDIELEIAEEDWSRGLLQRHMDEVVDAVEFESFFGFEPQGDLVLERALEMLLNRPKTVVFLEFRESMFDSLI